MVGRPARSSVPQKAVAHSTLTCEWSRPEKWPNSWTKAASNSAAVRSATGIRRSVLEQAVHDALRRSRMRPCDGIERAGAGKADDGCLVFAERFEDRCGSVVDDRALVAAVAIALDRVVFGHRAHVAVGECARVLDEPGAVVAMLAEGTFCQTANMPCTRERAAASATDGAQRAVVRAIRNRRRRVPDVGCAIRADRERAACDGDARRQRAREQREDPAGPPAHPIPREFADHCLELGEVDRALAMLRDKARLFRRERDAFLVRGGTAVEQAQVAGAIHGQSRGRRGRARCGNGPGPCRPGSRARIDSARS